MLCTVDFLCVWGGGGSNRVFETNQVTEGRMRPAGHMFVRPGVTRGTEKKKNEQQADRS